MNEAVASTHTLIRVHDRTSIQNAAQLMCDMSIGAVGVDDAEGRLVGLITERDLLWTIAERLDPSTDVKEVMNPEPVVVDGPVSPAEALEVMVSGHFRHLIVREGDDDLRILSMRDLSASTDTDSISHGMNQHAASASELRRMFGSI